MNKIRTICFGLIILLGSRNIFAQTIVISEETNNPVSFATVSFNNGYGVFADEDGKFFYSEKIYPGIDSLIITALGFKDLKLSTNNLPKILKLATEASELDEVVIRMALPKDFKEETLKPYRDNDYYKSWLPTVESEIAVFFPNEDQGLKKITDVHLPLTLESKDWEMRNKSNADKKPFSTLFKIKFYGNENGIPAHTLSNDIIVFRATEKMGDVFNLDVSDRNILIPKTGIYVSIQVLGYTDKSGKLLPNKKYKEIKTGSEIVRIPTNFRPLLPFTDRMEQDRTFIKRVFIQGNNWVKFNKENVLDSSLLKTGLNNYGMGISFNVYKDED